MAKTPSVELLKSFVRGRGQAYLDQKNVTSIGIGHKVKDGVATKELCIQFTVAKKVESSALEKLGEPELPKTVKIGDVDVPTDVLERRYATTYQTANVSPKDFRKCRQETLAPGISVASVRETAGTLGCFVYDAKDGTPYILSNWHVLHGPEGVIGDDVVQPGPYDDNRTEKNRIGRLVRSHLGVAGDCALASLDNRKYDPTVFDLDMPVTSLGKAELGDQVVKSGRTTGVTHGLVSRVEITVKMTYGGRVGEKRIGCFEITPDLAAPAPDNEISMGGDSGSAWLAKKDGKPTDIMLGLHFAGEASDSEPEHALACYAHAVFEKLEVVPVPPQVAERVVAHAAPGFDREFLGPTIPFPVLTDSTVKVSKVVHHTHFSLVMNKKRRFAQWVAWNIDGTSIRKEARIGFSLDPDVDPKYQVGAELYEKNRLDQGHIARRQDLVWGTPEEAARANKESFYFSNITPQLDTFNQSGKHGLWGELENAIYDEVKIDRRRVSVLGGPIFDDDRDYNYKGVLVPRSFWKIIAFVEEGRDEPQVKAYVLTQEDLENALETFDLEPFHTWEVPVAEIERRTNLDFGPLSDHQNATEALGGRRELKPRKLESIDDLVAGLALNRA